MKCHISPNTLKQFTCMSLYLNSEGKSFLFVNKSSQNSPLLETGLTRVAWNFKNLEGNKTAIRNQSFSSFSVHFWFKKTVLLILEQELAM